MDIVLTKIIVALLFGLIRFLFGILPIKVYAWLSVGTAAYQEKSTIIEKRRHTLEVAIAIVQSFGGGVLFATSFLHMMPEVYVEVEELRTYGVLSADYPYSQLVVSLGFFTVYFTEEMSHWMISKTSKEPLKKRSNQSAASTRTVSTVVSSSSKIYPDVRKIPNGMAFEIEKKDNNGNNENQFNLEKREKCFGDDLEVEVVVDNIDQAVQTEHVKNLEAVQKLDNNLDLDTDANAEIEDFIEEKSKTRQQVMRCLMMVMALSLHAIFEGLAIGLQHSVANIWYLFTAVSIHSATILFVIGLEIVLSGSSDRTTMIHMSMLSSTSPFGVLLGLVITLTTDLHTSAKSLAIVLLEGLSAGTILYITFFETLSREKKRRTCRVARAISIGVGFTLMALLQCLKIGS